MRPHCPKRREQFAQGPVLAAPAERAFEDRSEVRLGGAHRPAGQPAGTERSHRFSVPASCAPAPPVPRWLDWRPCRPDKLRVFLLQGTNIGMRQHRVRTGGDACSAPVRGPCRRGSAGFPPGRGSNGRPKLLWAPGGKTLRFSRADPPSLACLHASPWRARTGNRRGCGHRRRPGRVWAPPPCAQPGAIWRSCTGRKNDASRRVFGHYRYRRG